MEALTSEHVHAALRALGLDVNIMHFETSTATSQQAADNIGCQLGQIVKSLCFVVEMASGTRPVLALTSGDQRVDERKLAAFYNVSRKRVRAATADECVTIWGYAPGSVPPVGHRVADMDRYIDASLMRFDQLYAAGGAHNAIFPITLEQLQRITGAQVVDFVRDTG
ncbi:MAG: YbaK/EbsC family protein [Anaerolinea sp.]|nr:YbaK/EbsC family protein [Anaerolinea sp.]